MISVQFGRGKWLPFAWMRGLLLAVNVILVLSAPFVVAGAATAVNNGWYSTAYADDSGSDLSGSGLLENGNQVSNIFAYDAQGNPLTDVQLYDQDGKPLNLSGDPASPTFSVGSGILVPNQEVPGRLGWNVFPLGHVSEGDLTDRRSGEALGHADACPAAVRRRDAARRLAELGPADADAGADGSCHADAGTVMRRPHHDAMMAATAPRGRFRSATRCRTASPAQRACAPCRGTGSRWRWPRHP